MAPPLFLEPRRALNRCTQRHHARIIAKLGGTATAVIHAPEVKRTRENLQASKVGEEYERDVMYADFIAEAEASGSKEAIRSFTLARKAEAADAKLYGHALQDLETYRAAKTYYVFFVCGDVTERPEETGTARFVAQCKRSFW